MGKSLSILELGKKVFMIVFLIEVGISNKSSSRFHTEWIQMSESLVLLSGSVRDINELPGG